LFFAQKSLTKNRLVFWSVAVKEKPTVGSFFGVFPSDRTLKATEDVTVQKFPSRSKSCKLNQRIPVNYADEFGEFSDAAAYIP
jgi:hypothetical protein